jgi:nucleoside-diphosphate-sugar epimerase
MLRHRSPGLNPLNGTDMTAPRTKVLVTGATGFLGGRLARRLVDEDYEVRAFARKRSNTAALKKLDVEIALGDLGDESSVAAAVNGVDIVVHAAAGTSGTAQDSYTATVQGTRNVLEACRSGRVKKLIYISSCNVYEVAGYTENQVVTEEAQLERSPLRRGHYTAAKLLAEGLVTAAMKDDRCRIVVLRPGTLYGPGAEVYTKMLGISFGARFFFVFGDGDSALPLVHVDNTVDAVVECIRRRAADNRVFNVVDQDLVTKRMYMKQVVAPLYPQATVIYCPMSLLIAATWLQERVLRLVGKTPYLTVYRLVSSQKRVRYSTTKIETTIGWRSRIRFGQGADQQITEHRRRASTESRSAVP